MSTWGVLKFVFLYVFLMKIYSSEGYCADYLDLEDSDFEDWKSNLPIPEEYLRFPVSNQSKGKADVIYILNTLCCRKQEKERKNNILCKILRNCNFTRGSVQLKENCSLDDAAMHKSGVYVSLSDLRCMIAEAAEPVINDLEGCHNRNPDKNLFRCTEVTSTTRPPTPASSHSVAHPTPSLTTTTHAAKQTTSTQPFKTTRPTHVGLVVSTTETTTTETTTETSTHVQTGDNVAEDGGADRLKIEPKPVAFTTAVSIFLVLSLILNVFLGAYVIRQNRNYKRYGTAVPLEDAMTNGDDQNDTDV